jgi:hypothetical protein
MQQTKCSHCDGNHVRRRDFLRLGALSFLGINLGQYLALKEAVAANAVAESKKKAEACILLWLDGGPSQVDTWDPKPKSSFKPIATNVDGIQISELFPRIAKQMDKLAIIRSIHTEENNHGVGTHYVATGQRPNPAMKFPGIGSIITKELGSRNSIPPHVMVPSMPKGKDYDEYFKAHFLGAEYDPMIIPDPNPPKTTPAGQIGEYIRDFKVPDLSLPESLTLDQVRDRRSFLKIVDQVYREKVETAEFVNADRFTEQAWNMILSPAVREAFDISKEPEKVREAYGHNAFGQSVLLARRLLEAGSRFITAGGFKGQAWDTHYDNDRLMRDQLSPYFDQTFSTLVEDLHQRGLLQSTILIVMGEFGRTADVNLDGGRDHWAECWSMLLGGGGLRGGTVVGASDAEGAYVADRMVSMGDVFASIYKAMGVDWHTEYIHPVGRPIKIANSFNDLTGTPVKELI